MQLTRTETVGYSLGGLGKNIAYMMVSSYTLYYYNSVLNISASFVAFLLMLARFFDAFNDPFMGLIVSKTNSRWGKYKPWILSGAVLNSLIMIAMFTVPQSLGTTGIKFYITITYFICGITYTLTDIPYWSVIPAITHPGKERERLTLFTRIMSGIGSGVASAFTMMFVAKLGGGYDSVSYRKGFSLLAIIVAFIYTALTVITVLTLPKERYSDNSENLSIKELFIALLHNDQAMMISLIIILFYSATNITLNLALYVFDKDLHQPDMYTTYMVVVGTSQFIGMTVLYPLMRKKFTNRGTFQMGIILSIIGYIAFFAFTFIEKLTFGLLVAPSVLIALSIGIAYILITIFIANAVDYGEAKSGQRQNSMVSSLQTLMSKLATSIAVFLSGIGLDIVKYTEEIEQTGDVILRSRLLFSVPSLVLIIISYILLSRRKDL